MARGGSFGITKSRLASGHTHHKVPKQARVKAPPNSRGSVNKSGRKMGAR